MVVREGRKREREREKGKEEYIPYRLFEKRRNGEEGKKKRKRKDLSHPLFQIHKYDLIIGEKN